MVQGFAAGGEGCEGEEGRPLGRPEGRGGGEGEEERPCQRSSHPIMQGAPPTRPSGPAYSRRPSTDLTPCGRGSHRRRPRTSQPCLSDDPDVGRGALDAGALKALGPAGPAPSLAELHQSPLLQHERDLLCRFLDVRLRSALGRLQQELDGMVERGPSPAETASRPTASKSLRLASEMRSSNNAGDSGSSARGWKRSGARRHTRSPRSRRT